jgi:hypothetical protein
VEFGGIMSRRTERIIRELICRCFIAFLPRDNSETTLRVRPERRETLSVRWVIS